VSLSLLSFCFLQASLQVLLNNPFLQSKDAESLVEALSLRPEEIDLDKYLLTLPDYTIDPESRFINPFKEDKTIVSSSSSSSKSKMVLTTVFHLAVGASFLGYFYTVNI
jgi:hypothetical protein